MRFFLLVATIFPFFLPAQVNDAQKDQFKLLVASGAKPEAFELLENLLREDSTGVFLLASTAEKLILPEEEKGRGPEEGQIRLLFRVYELGSRHDPAGPAAWYIREALLALRYPAVFEDETRFLLGQAVRTTPETCPLFIFEKWVLSEIEGSPGSAKAPGNRNPASTVKIATTWQEISDLLYLRQIRSPQDASATGRLHQRLALRVRDALPDCGGLSSIFARQPEAKDCAAFLILSDLQNCDPDPGLWANAFTCATAGSAAAWMYRLAAARKLDERDYLEALKNWELAEKLEPDPARKASDLLRQAEILAMMKQYAQARSRLQVAITTWPNWSDPYFQLCDLYLGSVEDCNFSAFDRKAIYWLAIDLCQTAQNADPACEQEAANRVYRYRQLAPTAKEIAFKGLKSGDTWPLRCWMSTVTTVKVD